MDKSFALVTTLGQGMLAEAIREGTFVGLKEVAVGDADYTPMVGQTAMVSEQARIPITNITYDQDNPHWLRISAVIAPDIGGWYIREVGIFAENGNLFAIAKLDGTYKPVYTDGLLKEITLDFILEVTSANNVTMVVDPHVIIATREWVLTYVDPKFASLEEMVRGRVPQSRQVKTAAPLSGGGDLSADRTIALTGIIQMANGGTGNTTGLAASATKLATARSFRTNLASTATASFDGTANITPGVTGVLPVANGGTGNTTGSLSSATKLATARSIHINLASTLAAGFDGTADVSPGVTGVLPMANGGTGNTAGLAASATKLATARSIQIDLASGSAVSFNGTANVSPGVTGVLPIANGGTGNTLGAIDSATQLATARTFLTNLASTVAGSFNGTANVSLGVTGVLPITNGGTGNTVGLAASATILATARTFRTNLASAATASFDGSANVTPGVTGTLPIANGGTGNTTGLAASAAQLATARTIQTNLALTTAASFNGSANVTPGVTGILPIANGGTGNTAGAAASASKLTTARTIRTDLALTSTASFDGSANVTPGVTGVLPVTNGGTGTASLYGTCSTAADTAAKIGNLSGFTRATGSIVGLRFTYANTATSPTLDVNGTGAAYICYQGTYVTAGMIRAGHHALFQFNGSRWELLNPVVPVVESATKLATARTIRTNLAATTTASFDGTANVTPGVAGTLPITNGGTGNTTGQAVSATKLATARTFQTNLGNGSLASFDGSANVTPGVFGILSTSNGGTGSANLKSARQNLGVDYTLSGGPGASAGYYVLPGGLILQWGSFGNYTTITFPIAFQTTPMAITCMQYGPGTPIGSSTLTATGFTITATNAGGRWMALGY